MHVVYRFSVGGLENGLVNLINRMPADRYRHAVIAMTECDPTFTRRITRPDVPYISLQKPPGHGIRLYPAFYRLCRQLKPAVVHTRNLAALELSAPAWAAGVRMRVHGEHGWDERDRGGENIRYRRIRKAYAPFVGHYVALSGQIEHYLQQHIRIPAERVTRICNGVDSMRFAPPEGGREPIPGNPFSPSCRFVGTVGRLQAVKDQTNLVRAFAMAWSTGQISDWRLLVAGDGPLRPEVVRAIAETGLADRVWLAGERADVPAVLRGLDLFVLPSQSEGISNTILEAMATGLPVIATQVGGNGELVVEGDTGALVPAMNAPALAETMVRYMTSVERLREYGKRARRRIEAEFSLDGMIARYDALYSRLLGG